jgi:hypothetical protein
MTDFLGAAVLLLVTVGGGDGDSRCCCSSKDEGRFLVVGECVAFFVGDGVTIDFRL